MRLRRSGPLARWPLLLLLLLLRPMRGALGFQSHRRGRGGPGRCDGGKARRHSRGCEFRTTTTTLLLPLPLGLSSAGTGGTGGRRRRRCRRGGASGSTRTAAAAAALRRSQEEASFRVAAAAMTATATMTWASNAAAAAAAEAAVSIPTEATATASAAAYVAGAWSVFLMLVLVGLLTVWEQGVKNLQQTLPQPLRPVINSVLGEMGGLGFIGLLLSTLVTNNVVGEWLEHAGEATLHDSEILVETFEFLHTAFFQVGMTFFGVAALLVLRSLRQLAILDEVTQVAMSADNFNCLAALAAESSTSSASSSSSTDAPMPTSAASTVSTEDLLVRERLVLQFDLNPAQFRVENYFGSIMGTTLEELVELAPCTAWLPLIPALSQGRSIDMSHDVVSASSNNALASAGYFVSTPSFVTVSALFAVLGMVWGGWNYWKMNEMKRMVLPAVQGGRGGADEEAVRMVDPPYLNATQLAAFDSSPSVLGWIEAAVVSTFFDEEKEDKCEDLDSSQGRQLRLFGQAGEAGPELYLRSIKFHTWLVTTQVVFWGTQIVARDVNAVSAMLTGAAGSSAEIGRPEFVVAELLLYGTFVGAALFQLLYVAPQTFWNYILVTSVEEFAKPELLRASCCDIGILDAERG
jgi:hypothetical protein